MKYIRFKQLGLVIFEDSVQHANIASMLHPFEPISAGFVHLTLGVCYGDSMSLNLQALPEDTTILRETARMRGLAPTTK